MKRKETIKRNTSAHMADYERRHNGPPRGGGRKRRYRGQLLSWIVVPLLYDLLFMCRSHFLLFLQTMTTLTAVSNVEDTKNLFLVESGDCYSRLRNRYEYSRHRIALVVFSSDCFIVDIGRSKGRGRCRVHCKDRRGELRG